MTRLDHTFNHCLHSLHAYLARLAVVYWGCCPCYCIATLPSSCYLWTGHLWHCQCPCHSWCQMIAEWRTPWGGNANKMDGMIKWLNQGGAFTCAYKCFFLCCLEFIWSSGHCLCISPPTDQLLSYHIQHTVPPTCQSTIHTPEAAPNYEMMDQERLSDGASDISYMTSNHNSDFIPWEEVTEIQILHEAHLQDLLKVRNYTVWLLLYKRNALLCTQYAHILSHSYSQN